MSLIRPISIGVLPLVASVPPALLAIPDQLAFALNIPALASVQVLQEAAGRLVRQLGGQTFAGLTDPQREALVALVQSNLVESSPDLVAALETLVRRADAAKGAERRPAPRVVLEAQGRFRLLGESLDQIQGMIEQGDLTGVVREGRALLASVPLDPVAWENPDGDFLARLTEWVRLFRGFVAACEEGRLRGVAAGRVLRTLRQKHLPALPLPEIEVTLGEIYEEDPPAEPVREVLDWTGPITAITLAGQVVWNLERMPPGKRLRIRTRPMNFADFNHMGTALWRALEQVVAGKPSQGESDPLSGKSALLIGEGMGMAFLFEFKFERGAIRTSSHLVQNR